MMQVLRSQDRALLERCFAVSSEDVINNTVKRLSSPDAVLLLRAAIQRLQSRPLRGEQLQTWIRAMLVSHTAYFISAPGAQLNSRHDAAFITSEQVCWLQFLTALARACRCTSGVGGLISDNPGPDILA